MSKWVTRQTQPMLAWGLMALLLLAIVFFGILPALAKSGELTEKIESGYQRLTKMRQIAYATPELMSEYERVRRQGLDKLFYPEGMTAAQVAKELQKQLSAVIVRHKGVLVSSQVLPQDTDEADSELSSEYSRVSVQGNFQGDMKLLREILHQSYRSRPLIFVDRIEVKPQRNKEQQSVNGLIRVSTYWRGGEHNEVSN